MSSKISKKDLMNYLQNLKKALAGLDFTRIYNIVFYNFESYIKYVNAQCYQKEEKDSVEEILCKIERFIPFDFDEKTIDFLITRAIDNYDAQAFQDILIKRAKVDFIKAVREADTKEKWEKLIRKCKYIHEHNENNGLLYV